MCSLLSLLTIPLQLAAHYGRIAKTFHFTCLHFFLAVAALWKLCQGNFKDTARVRLTVLKKKFFFRRFQNGSINLLGNTSEENWFLNF